jgi:hypothetical protein
LTPLDAPEGSVEKLVPSHETMYLALVEKSPNMVKSPPMYSFPWYSARARTMPDKPGLVPLTGRPAHVFVAGSKVATL